MLKKITTQDEKFEAALKKITAKQDEKIDATARAEFSTKINKLYHARMAGQPATDPDPDPDVRGVAFGLVALKQALLQAIKPFLRKYRNDPEARKEALVARGYIVADGIITALTTTGRRDHPLWKHIDSLQTSSERATAGANQRRRWEMLAGVAIAYQEATGGGSLRAATRAVCESIQAKDFPVNPEQLRKRMDRHDKAANKAAKQYAKIFLAEAKAIGRSARGQSIGLDPIWPKPAAALPQCVIIVGRKALSPFLVIPS
jgi:hypothetical protein